jgi:hypothetical protein
VRFAQKLVQLNVTALKTNPFVQTAGSRRYPAALAALLYKLLRLGLTTNSCFPGFSDRGSELFRRDPASVPLTKFVERCSP